MRRRTVRRVGRRRVECRGIEETGRCWISCAGCTYPRCAEDGNGQNVVNIPRSFPAATSGTSPDLRQTTATSASSLSRRCISHPHVVTSGAAVWHFPFLAINNHQVLGMPTWKSFNSKVSIAAQQRAPLQPALRGERHNHNQLPSLDDVLTSTHIRRISPRQNSADQGNDHKEDNTFDPGLQNPDFHLHLRRANHSSLTT